MEQQNANYAPSLQLRDRHFLIPANKTSPDKTTHWRGNANWTQAVTPLLPYAIILEDQRDIRNKLRPDVSGQRHLGGIGETAALPPPYNPRLARCKGLQRLRHHCGQGACG